MILGTFSGADYPLNAMPVRGMQEVTQAYRDPMCKMRVARKRSPADFINQQFDEEQRGDDFFAGCRTSPSICSSRRKENQRVDPIVRRTETCSAQSIWKVKD